MADFRHTPRPATERARAAAAAHEPDGSAQRGLAERVQHSPRATIQRLEIDRWRGPPVQAKLKVGGVDRSQREAGPDGQQIQVAAAHAWDAMVVAVRTTINASADNPDLQRELTVLAERLNPSAPRADVVYAQLTKWIDDRPHNEKIGKHPIFGRKQQNREYDNWVEVARALVGWVDAKAGRHNEKAFAQQLYNNPIQDAVLNSLAHKVRLKIESLKVPSPQRYLEIIRELASDKTSVRTLQGHVKQDETPYGHYEKEMAKAAVDFNQPALKVRYATKLEILDKPEAFSMRDKMILLHDITEYFGKHQPWNPVTAGQGLIPVDNERDALVTVGVDALGERTQAESAMTKDKDRNKLARGMGKTTASRDEGAPSTKLARALNLPIWAGQSMTTVRMLNMAQWAGGKVFEMNALAQGIFAFWRLEYNHTSDFAYHTLHEVMDMAKNFGVAYRMQPGHGMQFDQMNEAFVRPAVHGFVQAMMNGYLSLEGQINANNWVNQEYRRTADVNLNDLKRKVEQVVAWWQAFDFGAGGDACRAGLTKVMQGLNLVQLDMHQLDSFVKLRSSTIGVGFWS